MGIDKLSEIPDVHDYVTLWLIFVCLYCAVMAWEKRDRGDD